MTTVQDIAKAIVPEFPSDRSIEPTRDPLVWYKTVASARKMLVPPIQVLKGQMAELDRFIEAVKAFCISNLDSRIYDWDNLQLYEATGSDSADKIRWMHQLAASGEKEVAIDIETKRIEWEDNRLLAIGFAWTEDCSLAVYDCFDTTIYNPVPQLLPEVHKELQQFFDDQDICMDWQNGKFDCGRLKYLCNLDARIDQDTMLQHYVQINERRGSHGLKDLGQLYLQAPPWDDQLDKIKKDWCRQNKVPLKQFTYDLIPTSTLIPYMQRDTIATRRLRPLFAQLARPESEFIYGKLIEASNVYKDIEVTGHYIDLDYLEQLEYDLEVQLRKETEKMNSAVQYFWNPMLYVKMTGAKSVPKEFSMKSPKQLKWMLQEAVGYPLNSTDADTIKMLVKDVERGKITDQHSVDFITSIGKVRKYNKYMDTYVQGLREVMCRDQRIRGTFNLHGTETGRLSSSNPNMQNIPRDAMIKNILCAAPGYRMLQLDYSQAELRVLAILSGDEGLIQVYADGRDLHGATARDLFGDDYTKEDRNMAKTVNFGIVYGRGPASITEAFPHVPVNEARRIIAKWMKTYPKVEQFIFDRRRMARAGEPCTTLFGRERHFVITDGEMYHIENEYINTPIQSIASDLTVLSLLRIARYLKDNNFDGRVNQNVHDSIILEVPDDDDIVQEIARQCIDIMATTPQLYIPNCPVPFVADAEHGYRWGELKELVV